MHSYHIFYFPFQWERHGGTQDSFSERFDPYRIEPLKESQWNNLAEPITPDYAAELFNEKNFFYEYIHSVLYDEPGKDDRLIRHFERKEAYSGELHYTINIISDEKSTYTLLLKSIVLNLYSTGTGILMFYLENHDYPEFKDILRINQFGRRVYPPFLGVKNGIEGAKTSELADSISITGLFGPAERYSEDFLSYKPGDAWKPGRFIWNLIEDLSTQLKIRPVVDDRMFCLCFYLNQTLADKIKNDSTYPDFLKSEDWYSYLFVDRSTDSTCKNSEMLSQLVVKQSYPRWQRKGTLYGISRYSFVAISEPGWFSENILLTHMRTMYARIAELALIQRASILKFSEEVTHLSGFPEKDSFKLVSEISNFYKEYIRFVNQIYFREITAQEQGIELYDMMQTSMKLPDQVKDLDGEIEELHNYATILDDKAQSRSLGILTIIGSLFLAPSFLVGYYNLSLFGQDGTKMIGIIILPALFLIAMSFYGLVYFYRRNNRRLLVLSIIIIAITTLLSLLIPLI